MLAKTNCTGAFNVEMERFWCFLRAHSAAASAGSAQQVADIQAEVDARYLKTRAPLIVDLTGFSRTVRKEGVVSALSLVRAVWDLLQPVVLKAGGTVLKNEADTFYAVLADAPTAAATALAMEDELDQLNKSLCAARGKGTKFFCSSIGIGYGPIYLIGNEDAFGQPVNFAYNLGENIAESGEILLTEEADKALGGTSVAGIQGTTKLGIARDGSRKPGTAQAADVAFFTWRVERVTPSMCSGTSKKTQYCP